MTDILSAAEIDALFNHGGQVFGLQNATAAADHTENLNEIPIPETEV
jgi:hypothetical protein